VEELLLSQAAHENPVQQLLRLLIGCHLLVAFHETGRHTSGCLSVPESGTTNEVMDLVDLRLVQ
jgi:hypothetical protein